MPGKSCHSVLIPSAKAKDRASESHRKCAGDRPRSIRPAEASGARPFPVRNSATPAIISPTIHKLPSGCNKSLKQSESGSPLVHIVTSPLGKSKPF